LPERPNRPKGEAAMGIQSRIRIQYFRDDVLVPLSNVMLYPNGSDVVHTADIDQSILDAVFDGVEAAWDAVTIGVDLLSGNWLAAGFSAADLADNLSALKNDLADKTRVDVTSLGLSYPHLLYNKLHIIFEADSTSDGSGDMDPLTDSWPFAGGGTPYADRAIQRAERIRTITIEESVMSSISTNCTGTAALSCSVRWARRGLLPSRSPPRKPTPSPRLSAWCKDSSWNSTKRPKSLL
jgi:hypothetical protein